MRQVSDLARPRLFASKRASIIRNTQGIAMKRTKKHRYRPRLDVLESRHLPAASLTAALTGDILRIEGTEAADNITVRQANGLISVANVRILVDGQAVPAVDATRVKRVDVFALGGNDSVSLGSLSKNDPALAV